MRTRYIILTLILIAGILNACTGTPKAIEGADRNAVLAYSEPKADNELAALNAKDYQAFIKDYDSTMRSATTPENFATLTTLISSKLGQYLSREVVSVASIGEDAVVIIYRAKFEKEDGVTVQMVFQPSGEHLITGLWLDSPKLREK